MATIFFHFLRFDAANPRSPYNDRFVLSKGHAAPILWGAWAEAGVFPVERLETLRRIDSDLEGHPTPRNPLVDVATGSLGQGLSVGVGMALGARVDQIDNRVFVLLGNGDGTFSLSSTQSAGGPVWMLVCGVVAVRQALDFTTGKAIGTVVLGWLAFIAGPSLSRRTSSRPGRSTRHHR